MPRAVVCQPQLFARDVVLASTCNAVTLWSPATSNTTVPLGRTEFDVSHDHVQQWAMGLMLLADCNYFMVATGFLAAQKNLSGSQSQTYLSGWFVGSYLHSEGLA